MATQSTLLTPVAPETQPQIAGYFGLAIEVIEQMEHCSLIRWRNREHVISTEDLGITMPSAHSVLLPSMVEVPGKEYQHKPPRERRRSH
jgi:hypothetical protein